MADDLFEHPERTLSWLSDHTGELFLARIKGWHDMSVDQLKKAEENDVYRWQGKIAAYASILDIEKHCRNLIEDKKVGRRS
jgi:hypothetical protein